MNKPIVLVIHGMGTHAPGTFKKDINDGLNEAAKNFGLAEFDFSEKVEFYQFNYSTFLDEIRANDAAQTDSITDHLALLQGHGLGESIVMKLTEFFADFDEDDMLYTHWMDVVYYGLMFWGEKIRVDFAKRINDIMIEANAENRDVHIIAHSLGTAVAHDTLAKLFRNDVDITSEVPGLDLSRFKIKSLWTVANVSRLLHILNDIADPYHSVVNATANGCCDYLFNIRNKFDPFTWVKTYERNDDNYQLLEVDTIRKWNTHDMKEYMATPLVSSYIFSFILGDRLEEEQWDTGVIKHGETSLNKHINDLNGKFNDLKNLRETMDKVEALKQMFTIAKEFRERMKEIVKETDND